MRVAFVHALPFHEWILSEALMAFVRAGHEVLPYTHYPSGPHDWITKTPAAARWLKATKPDLIVCAEYPCAWMREACGAPVLTTRHSLAARGNTWMPENAEADYIATWSRWDENEFARRGVAPRRGFIRSGCVFASRRREVKSHDLRVLWAPTWNPEFSCRDRVLEELTELREYGAEIVIRPHAATVWREPDFVRSCHLFGRVIQDGPFDLSRIDVVISDVSGAALLPLTTVGARVPVVFVDPPDAALCGAQYDPTGPEWTFRSSVGARCPEGEGVCAEAIQAATGDALLPRRMAVSIIMFEHLLDGAADRLVSLISEEI